MKVRGIHSLLVALALGVLFWSASPSDPWRGLAAARSWCDVVYGKLVEPGQQIPGFLFETPEGYVLLRETSEGIAKVAARSPEELERQFKIVEDISLARALGKGSDAAAVGPESFAQHLIHPAPDNSAPAFKAHLQNPANWKPERATLHRAMAETQLEKTRELSKAMRHAVGNAQPTLLLLRGNTASGKSTTLKKGQTGLLTELKAADYLEAIRDGAINPDLLKYQLMLESPGATSSFVHEEGSNLADRVIDSALDEKLSFVIDKRFLSVSSVESIAKKAKRKGYRVVMLDVDVGLEASASRLLWREPGTADPNVPFEAVAQGFKQARSERKAIAQSPWLDAYELLTTDGAHSTLVASKKADGSLSVHDEGVWQKRTTVPEGEVESAADRLRHVVDLLSTVDTGDYGMAAALKTWLPRIPFEVPRWESFLELEAHDARRTLTPFETFVPRPVHDAFVKSFREQHRRSPTKEELIRFAREREADISGRLKKFFKEVRRGAGADSQWQLALALKDHFESSFHNAKVRITPSGRGYLVAVEGLSAFEQNRLAFDEVWEAKRAGGETFGIWTDSLGPNPLRMTADPEHVHGPGFWHHSDQYPYYSPHQIVRRYGGTMDYLKDLRRQNGAYVHPHDPMLMDFQPAPGQEFHFSRFNERRFFANGFRSDEPAAYHAGATATYNNAAFHWKVGQGNRLATKARDQARALAIAATENARLSSELAKHALNALKNSETSSPHSRWVSDESQLTDFSSYLLNRMRSHVGGSGGEDPFDFNTELDAAGGRILWHRAQLSMREGAAGINQWKNHREKAKLHYEQLLRANDRVMGDARLLLNELARIPAPGQTEVVNPEAYKTGGFVKAPLTGSHRKVAVLPGTFDPLHEGHVNSALELVRQLGFDEVVLSSNPNPDRKPGATPRELRDKMVAVRVPESPGLNAYFFHESQGPFPTSGGEVIARMKQVYGTDQVYSVIGDDVYLEFKKRGKFDKPNGIQYVVLLRGPDSPLLKEPGARPSNVTFFDPGNVNSISSTKVRNTVKAGLALPPDWIHPAVGQLIDDEKLYRDR